MRKVLYFIAIAITVQACQKPDELASAKKELETLKTEKKEIEDKIEELSKTIAKLDTTEETLDRTLVSLIKPVKKPFVYNIQVPGTADSRQNIVVSAESMGNVTKIYVQEGQMVKKGQTIASIDSEVMSTQIAELQTRLELAQELYEKQKRLWEKNIGSEVQFLQAKNNKESLEQSINSLKAQAAKSKISAPISGYLDEVFLREGQTVSMGMPAIRIVDLGNIVLTADVSEKYIGQITTKDSIKVHFPSAGKTYIVKISNIGQVVNSDNRTFTIEATIKNTDGIIKPNVLADVTIPVYVNKDAMVIPTSIIQQGKNDDFVYKASEQAETGLTASRQVIKLGKSYNGLTEVLEGLTINDDLVKLGSRMVADGEPLKAQ